MGRESMVLNEQARRASHEDLSLDFPLYSFPPPDIPPHNLSLRSGNHDDDHAVDNIEEDHAVDSKCISERYVAPPCPEAPSLL